MNLVQKTVQHNGRLSPLIIPAEITNGTGLMNPSIFIDDDGDILCIVRHINYSLYHSENTMRFPSIWGPLAYLHPEQDQHLRTTNYLCRLNDDLTIAQYRQIEMLNLHEPIWEFVGLEDARLSKWNGKYYISGVRRDTTPNGQGRMELCQIEIDKTNWSAKEVSRQRIEVTDTTSYCEKNWMAIQDRPFEYIKWTAPTEVVSATSNPAQVVSLKEGKQPPADQRGGSQVIRWGEYYIAVTHEVVLFKNYMGQKNGTYRHRLCVWNQDFELIGFSPENWSFLDGQIEFCAGIAEHNGDLLIGFGFQDNAAFMLQVPQNLVNEMVAECL